MGTIWIDSLYKLHKFFSFYYENKAPRSNNCRVCLVNQKYYLLLHLYWVCFITSKLYFGDTFVDEYVQKLKF